MGLILCSVLFVYPRIQKLYFSNQENHPEYLLALFKTALKVPVRRLISGKKEAYVNAYTQP